jgi:hypothetical protein
MSLWEKEKGNYYKPVAPFQERGLSQWTNCAVFPSTSLKKKGGIFMIICRSEVKMPIRRECCLVSKVAKGSACSEFETVAGNLSFFLNQDKIKEEQYQRL